jgi:uncharacterized delta-60 repeat protein
MFVKFRSRITAGWLGVWTALVLSGFSSTAQVISFQAASASISESETNLSLVVTRAPAAGVAAVDYFTVPGTAVALEDYVATSGRVTFAIGEVFKIINLPIVNDINPEAQETFSVVLTNATGASLQLGTNVVTITDDDAFYNFTLPVFSVSEGATNFLVTINRNGAIDGPGRIDFGTLDGVNTNGFLNNAISGVDYLGTNRTVEFTNGQSAVTFGLPILDNTIAKLNPSFSMFLTNEVGGTLATPSIATVTIVDNDSTNGTIQIFSVPQIALEPLGTNQTTTLITVVRVGGSAGAVSVSYRPLNSTFIPGCPLGFGTNATQGLDYTGGSGVLSWAAGDSAPKFITITHANDDFVELDENIVIGLFNPVGGGRVNTNITGIVTVFSDDDPPGAALSAFNTVSVVNPNPGANNSINAAVLHSSTNDPNFGKVVIGGDFTGLNSSVQNRVSRINSDGSLDTSFVQGTGADGVVNSIAISDNGLIYIAGGFTSYNNISRRGVARLNPDGSLDLSFDVGAGVAGTVNEIVLQGDGKLIAGGEFELVNNRVNHRLVRFNTDGSVDDTFDAGDGPNSQVLTIVSDFLPDLIPIGQGAAIANSNPFPNGTNGNHFHSFGSTPFVEIDVGSWLTTEEMRGVVEFPITQRSNAFNAELVFQYTSTNGQLGSTFGVFDFTVEILGGNGLVEITDWENTNVLGTLTNMSTTDLVLSNTFTFDVFNFYNQAVASGFSGLAVRFRPTTDPGTNTGVSFGNFQLTLGGGGGTFVGGDFTQIDGVPVNRVAKLQGNGSVDFSFVPFSGPDRAVLALALQRGDNRLLIGGEFQSYDGASRRGLTRVLANGLNDPSFDPKTGVDGVVRSILLQTNGQVVIGGDFDAYAGVGRTNYARLYSDGILDTSFLDPFYNRVHAGSSGPVFDLSLMTNGSILVVGAFDRIGAGVPPIEVIDQFNIAAVAGTQVSPTENNPGNVLLSSAEFSVDENVLGGVVNIGVQRQNGFLGDLTVRYRTVNGTAVEGRDFIGTTGVVSFVECSNLGLQQFFAVPIIDNSVLEGNRNFRVVLDVPSSTNSIAAPALGITTIANVTVVDNEFEVGTIGFDRPVYSVSESVGRAAIQLVRTNGTIGTVSVDVLARAGSATSAVDFVETSTTLTFNSGQSNASLFITVIDDSAIEFEETVRLSLTNATGGAGISGTNANLLIQDNDNGAGSVSFAAHEFYVAEAGGTLTVSALRTSGSVGTVTARAMTVELPRGVNGNARTGVDFQGTVVDLTFPAGVTERSFTVPIFPDDLVEGSERFLLTLTNLSPNTSLGFLGTVNAVILDDDRHGDVGFQGPEFFVNERETGVVTLVRENGSDDIVSVDVSFVPLTASTNDFSNPSTTVTFLPGEVLKTISVTITNDLLLESPEQIQVSITNFSKAGIGRFTNATLTIFDDEAISGAAGSIDSSFFTRSSGFINSVVRQPNDRVIIAGNFTNYTQLPVGRLTRLNTNGLLDPTFFNGNGADAAVNALLLEPDGRIVFAGAFSKYNSTNRSRIAAINSDGTLASSFNPGGGFDGDVFALARQPDGKIIVGGAFLTFNGQNQPYVARLLPNGLLDPSFDSAPQLNARVFALAVQRDGKILIGGEFTNSSGVAVSRLMRLESNGAPDAQFVVGAGPNDSIRALLVLPDNRILAGGSFTDFSASGRSGIVRLNPTGSVDPTFVGTGAEGAVLSLARQPDGKLLLAGDFTAYSGVERGRIVRVLPDGAIDPGMNFGLGANSFVNALELQPDEKIIIGGGFTRFNDRPANHLVRVLGGNNNGSGAVEFTSPSYLVDENQGSGVVSIRRNGGLAGSVTVQYSTSDGTATNGFHYSAVSGSLTFAAGENQKQVGIPLINNPVLNTELSVNLLLTGALVDLDRRTNSILSIRDDDARIGFSSLNYSVNENAQGGHASITVNRTGATNATILVGFGTTTNGTATLNSDYAPTAGTLTFAPGVTSRIFSIVISNDNIGEPLESVNLVLTNLQFSQISTATIVPGITNATLTITDDEIAPGTLSFETSTLSVREGGVTVEATVTLVRTNGSSGTVTVDYSTADGSATGGLDYVPTSGTISFADGETRKTFNVAVLADTDASESTETVNISLSNSTGGAQTGEFNTMRLLIENNNILIFGNFVFSQSMYSAQETAGTATLSVNRIGGTQDAVSVNYSTIVGGNAIPRLVATPAGAVAHYVPTNGVLNWVAGESAAKAITVALEDNTLVDGDRNFLVSLSAALGGAAIGSPGVASVTVLDNDTGPGVIGFDQPLYLVSEDQTNAVIVVSRTNGFTGTATAQFTTFTNANHNANAQIGTGPTDPTEHYRQSSGTLTFADGVTSQIIVVPIHDNVLQDGTKTFGLNLTAAGGGAIIGRSGTVVRIADDELSAGSIDEQFFPGAGADGPIRSLFLTTNGQFYIGGNFTRYDNMARPHVARVKLDGSVDASFNAGAFVNGTNAATVESISGFTSGVSAGRVVAGGLFTTFPDQGVGAQFRTNVVMFLPDGRVDTNFNVGAGPNSRVRAVRALDNGQVVIAGEFTIIDGTNRNFVARLNANGTIDPGFVPGIGPNGTVRALALQPDGRLMIGGEFDQVAGITNRALARLNVDGTVDQTFTTATLIRTGRVHSIAVQLDGKVVIGGSFVAEETITQTNVVVVANGAGLGTATVTVDGTPFVSPLIRVTDNIVVSNNVLLVNGVAVSSTFAPLATEMVISYVHSRTNLARLNPGGSLDATFNSVASALLRTNRVELDASGGFVTRFVYSEGPDNFVEAVETQPDGKILIGGGFFNVAGVPRNRFARLNPNGTLDTSINTSIGANFSVFALAVQLDRKLLAAGEFTTFDRETHNRLVRLNGGRNVGPTVFGFSATNFVVSEASTNAIITVRRNGMANGDAFVHYGIGSAGTGRPEVDYSPVSGRLEFRSGEIFRNFNVPLVDDTIIDMDRTVSLVLSNASPGAIVDEPPVSTLSILENDLVLEFAASAFGVNENSTNATIVVRRVGGTTERVSVDYFTSSGTATGGQDYVDVVGTLTFDVGVSNQSFSIPIIDDVATEATESVNLGLRDPTPIGVAFLGERSTAVLNLIENEFAPGEISFSRTNFIVFENQPLAIFTVVRSNGFAGPVSLEFTTSGANATASPGVDFVTTNGVVSLADGESAKSFYVAIIDDGFVEPNEDFSVQLFNPSGGATIGVSNATMTIVGDDSFGVFEFTNTTFTVGEGVTNFVTEVVRRGGTNGTVTVDFATVPNSGTALTNLDYQPTGAVLTFAPGEVSRLVSVPVIDDSLVELTNESFSIHLINPTFDAVLGFTTNAVIQIVDNDVEFVFAATNFTVFEDGENGFVTILRQGVTNSTNTISIDLVTSNGLLSQEIFLDIVQLSITTNFLTNSSGPFPITSETYITNFATNTILGMTNEVPAVSPQHFVAATNRVVFEPGVLLTNVAVPIIDNNLVEPARNIHLSLQNPLPGSFVSVGSVSNAFLSIVDNDSALGLRPFSSGGFNYTVNEIETGQSLLIFEVERFGNNTGAVTVVVQQMTGTADATDFVIDSATVTFTNGQTIQAVTNRINGDRLPEGNEQYSLMLVNNFPTDSTSLTAATNATVTIIDNDTEFGFTVRQAVTNEDAGSYTLDVFRRGVLGPNDIVGFRTRDGTIATSLLPSARATLDYNSTNGVLVFGPNETLKSISVTLLPDELIEPVEYFGVLLENPIGFAGNTFVGASSNVLFQLLDSPGIVQFGRTGYVFGEENTNGALIEVRREGGSAGAVSVQVASAGNGAVAGFDFGQPTTNLLAAPIAPAIVTNITLSWADGETGIKSFVLPIIDDTQTNEPNESVTFTLVSPNGVLLGAARVSSAFIIDNDSPSSLDFTFQTGIGFNAPIFSVAQQSNGQLIVGGEFTDYVTNMTTGAGISRPHLARLDSNGGLDTSFNAGVGPDGAVRSLGLMSDGRMLIGGSFNSVGTGLRRGVARLLSNGALDLTFVPGTGTSTGGSVLSVALQADNRVLVGGSFNSFSSEQKRGIVRLTTSGSIDLSFSRGSGVSGIVNVVKVYNGQAGGAHDGKILLGGVFATYDGTPRNNLVRLTSSGTIDASFGIGSGPNSGVNEIEIEPNGSIVIGGVFTAVNGSARSRIARLALDGTVDPNFAPVLDDTVLTIAAEPDGRLIVGGGFDSLGGTGVPTLPGQATGPVTNVSGILRFDPAGLLDVTFPTGAGANDLVYDALIQSDRRIVIVGAFTALNREPVVRIVRYNGNSSRSTATVLATPGMSNDGRFMIQLSGEPGRAYRIESSDDLNSWQSVGEVASGLGAIVFDDPDSAARLRKFYRAVRLNQ